MARKTAAALGLGTLAVVLGVLPALAQSPGAQPNGAGLQQEPWPMNYLAAAGTQAAIVNPLLWGLIWLSIAVVVIIAVLVIVGIMVRGRAGRVVRDTPIERSGRGVLMIYVGVAVSTVVLIVYTGWTVATMAAISKPPSQPGLTIEVTAHQWWWEFTYDDKDDHSRRFVTANEAHIPVGVPVRFVIATADVIHSFWIPPLAGKTDAIPGRRNEAWLVADKPGVYRGQCTEYCGEEHSQMGLRVIADSPQDFAAWRDHQLADAAPPGNDLQAAGAQRFVLRCGGCHAVRGTQAGGAVGPNLSHLMTRSTIAAGMLKNNPANLGGWIANPQTIKPGNLMPNLDLSGPELHAIEVYLETLT